MSGFAQFASASGTEVADPTGIIGIDHNRWDNGFPNISTSNTAPSPADTTRPLLQVLPKPDQTEPDFFFFFLHSLLYLEQTQLHEKERGTNQYQMSD